MARALPLLSLPLVALAATPHAVLPLASNNSIASFGWYWAMEDGGGNNSAVNERNCTAPGPCSWDHANVDFVQNSWKSPSRWQPDGSSDWDTSDVLELASKNVRSVVSVSEFTSNLPLRVIDRPILNHCSWL